MQTTLGIIDSDSGSRYATWDINKGGSGILSSDKLTVSFPNGLSSRTVLSTIGKSSGKWYWEVHIDSIGAIGYGINTGISKTSSSYAFNLGLTSGNTSDGRAFIKASNGTTANTQKKYNQTINASPQTYGNLVALTSGQTLGFALDMDAGTISIYKIDAVGNYIAQTTDPMYSGLTGQWFAAVSRYSTTQAFAYTANFGATPFIAGTATIRTALETAGYHMGLYIE